MRMGMGKNINQGQTMKHFGSFYERTFLRPSKRSGLADHCCAKVGYLPQWFLIMENIIWSYHFNQLHDMVTIQHQEKRRKREESGKRENPMSICFRVDFSVLRGIHTTMLSMLNNFLLTRIWLELLLLSGLHPTTVEKFLLSSSLNIRETSKGFKSQLKTACSDPSMNLVNYEDYFSAFLL